MPDAKISDLTAASALTGTEEFPCSDGTTTTKAATANQIRDYAFDSVPQKSSAPSAPATGLKLYARNRAGRRLLDMIGPSGIDVTLQPGLFGNTIAMWLPGTGTTTSINFGTNFTARNSGTGAAQAHPTLVSTNDVTGMRRATFGTGTTTTGASGIQSGATVAWRGNAAGRGGFFFAARFALETYASDIRFFVGLSANNAAIAADPSSWNNTIGIGKDTGDSTIQLIQRNGSTATKTGTGITPSATEVLDLFMFAPPNGSDVTCRVVAPMSGTVYVDNVALNTTLPVSTTFMYMQAHIQAQSGTSAKLLALNKMYLETDL